MANKILVTGGAGYIGSIMVPELLAQGHEVTVVDNFMYNQNSLAHVAANPKFQIVRGDVRDAKIISEQVKKHDVIIPLAAYVGAPLCSKDPVGATTTNREAPLAMFKQLSKDQVVLMPTTNSAYGTGSPGHVFTEESPLSPLSLYSKDKIEVENALMSHPNAISFRLATVFGMSPRMRIDLLVNDFTYRALHDRFVVLFEGHFKRNFLHVRDVTGAFIHGMDNIDKMKGQIYNVGLSDANLSKFELCQAIQEFIPKFVYLEAPVGEDPDKRNYVISNEKIEKTGFRTKNSIQAGIQELIKGFTMLRNTRYTNV